MLKDELDDLRRRGMTALAEEKVVAIKKRFCDLPLYVKEVKERFSRWFNKRRGRKGLFGWTASRACWWRVKACRCTRWRPTLI